MLTRAAIVGVVFGASTAWAGPGDAATRVLVLSSGNAGLDATVQSALQSQGLVVSVGPEYSQFTNAVSLANVDVVYFQANYNWASSNMPVSGQQHLVSYVNGGGGLVTSEWVLWLAWATTMSTLEPIFPAQSLGTYIQTPSTTFTVAMPDPVMTAGLSSQFLMQLTSYAGSESLLTARPTASTFLTTSTWPGAPAVTGWSVGGGRVVSFSTVNGTDQFQSFDFVRLLANAMRWADGGAGCYPDCNGDGVLGLADFGCFQTKFALGDPYADCNGDGVLGLADFGCFQTKFALGCP
jgi:hypothetical protein